MRIWFALISVVALLLPAAAAPSERALLGANTAYHTPYYIFRGAAPGPRVLVESGIHGDELAGTYALDEMIRRLTVVSGTVIVIPRMNRPAVNREVRYINVDLNRAFGDAGRQQPYEFALAKEILALADREKIEYAITLHESHMMVDPAIPRALGQSLCYGVTEPAPLLGEWLGALNAMIAPTRHRFTTKYFPIPTSSTEVMVDRLHLKGGYCVETWRHLPLSSRIAMQKAAVETFLTEVRIDYRLIGR
ncbi:MAG: succinylglutamate desuccinylase/aspartoacylase family protein [Rhizomicrobium sp.]|nr:succinylglutamate desuccinylase/aspartoacylase family protein [Rhizomicrobium sp.]